MTENHSKPETDEHEDTSIGGITWHSSGPDEGPDVGISVYLGPNDRLWCGEVTNKLFEEQGKEHFDSDGGWFLIRYQGDDTKLIAKFGDGLEAREFIEQVAEWVRRHAQEATRLRETEAESAALSSQLVTGVLVPQSALDWLFGSGPDPDGKWFGEGVPERNEVPYPKYWWRAHFRKLIEQPPPQNSDTVEALKLCRGVLADLTATRDGAPSDGVAVISLFARAVEAESKARAALANQSQEAPAPHDSVLDADHEHAERTLNIYQIKTVADLHREIENGVLYNEGHYAVQIGHLTLDSEVLLDLLTAHHSQEENAVQTDELEDALAVAFGELADDQRTDTGYIITAVGAIIAKYDVRAKR